MDRVTLTLFRAVDPCAQHTIIERVTMFMHTQKLTNTERTLGEELSADLLDDSVTLLQEVEAARIGVCLCGVGNTESKCQCDRCKVITFYDEQCDLAKCVVEDTATLFGYASETYAHVWKAYCALKGWNVD